MYIKLMSVHDAWDYRMGHYYPASLQEFAQRTDTYAIISIQDAHAQGFGFTFLRKREL